MKSATARHRGEVRRRRWSLRQLFALVLIAPTLVLQAATISQANAALAAGFEIDGNLVTDAGGKDWDNFGDRVNDPTGTTDTSNFTQGSKEFNNPATWQTATGTSTNQGDIDDVYSYIDDSSGETWAFLGFTRVANNGTMTFMVEFNQQVNTGVRPVRTAGDLLLRFEQDGNGDFTLTTAYKWTESETGSFPAGCTVVDGYTPESAWCTQSLSGSGFVGASSADKLFAEGAVNLSAFDTVGDCRGAYGVMNVRSFSGESESSSLKDYIEPVPVSVPPSCGRLVIDKVDQFGDAVAGATFTITPSPIPGSAAASLTVTDGGANDPDGLADGVIDIDPAKPGTYTVEEIAAPAGYLLPEDPVWENVVVVKGDATGVSVDVVDPMLFAPPTATNEVTATYDVDHNWQVHKSVDDTAIDVPQGTQATFNYVVELEALPRTESGLELGGTLTVTNPNDHDMMVTVADVVRGDQACTFTGADESAAAGHQVTLDAGANPLAYTCPAGTDTTDAGTSTGTVTWDRDLYPSAGTITYPVTASADYTFVVDQSTDWETTVTDTFNGGAPQTLGTWNWGEVWAADGHTVEAGSYPRTVPGVPGECTTYRNTAAESADETTDSTSVEVCVGMDLDITKDATLGYHRTYDWLIDKSGPGTVFTGRNAQGELERMVRFGIDVTADGYHDSDWGLGGTIKVDNPNSWPVTGTLTDTVVIDTRTLTCTIDATDVDPGTAGLQVEIPAGAVDHEFTYTCNGVEQGDYVGANTATIDWSGADHPSPNTSDSATVDVEVESDGTPTNETITLTDELDGVEVDLPQSTFDWHEVNAADGHTVTIHYETSLGTTADACTPYTNVVTIDQTGQDDDHTVEVCSPGVEKSVDADFGRKQLWDLAKDVDKTEVEIAQDGTATFTYTVNATPGRIVDDGTASWSGTITVHNPSDTAPLTVDVTDIPGVTGWTCQFVDDNTQVALQPLATAELDYQCTGTGHPDGTNTAEVSWDGQTVSKQVPVSFEARAEVVDSVVTIKDDKTDASVPPGFLFTADASDPTTWTHEYSLVKAGVAGECTTYTNNAVLELSASEDPTDQAAATLCVEKPVTVDVAASGTYDLAYPWAIEKEVDKTTVEVDEATGEATFDYTVTVRAGEASDSGYQVTGSVTVDNPNTYEDGVITLTGGTLTTDLAGATCTFDDEVAGVVVPVDGTATLPFTCTFGAEPGQTGAIDAEVTWDPAGPADTASAEDSTDVSLTVGTETNKTVDVVDDKTDPANPVTLEEDLVWAEGLVRTYEYSLTHQGTAGECVDHTNTAIVDLPSGDDPEDGTTVTVCTEDQLDIDATIAGDFDRAYDWAIDKSVDATKKNAGANGTATFTYTVVASAGEATDSGWQVSGEVTVTNPNAYADGGITADVTATTDLGGGAVCTVTGGEDVDLAPGASATLPVECTFTSQPAASGTVTLDATWDPAGEATEATVSSAEEVTLTVDTETDKVVDIVDDKTRPGERVVLAEDVTWAEGWTETYTYSLALAGGAEGTCVAYTNTAMVELPEGEGPSDTVTVNVCTLEVAPAEGFKPRGWVKANCYGTVRARLVNRTDRRVTYTLRVGKKIHRVRVAAESRRTFKTKGPFRARVVLKVGKRVLDRTRIPARCVPPEVLPDTGLRTAATAARLAAIEDRWR
ncbi:MAG: prealbumin-like fold domain-containing protein [Nocardioides sp.]|nr:prealbumin-like fold domain-containing protein [Nocardioides sp.]